MRKPGSIIVEVEVVGWLSALGPCYSSAGDDSAGLVQYMIRFYILDYLSIKLPR